MLESTLETMRLHSLFPVLGSWRQKGGLLTPKRSGFEGSELSTGGEAGLLQGGPHAAEGAELKLKECSDFPKVGQ